MIKWKPLIAVFILSLLLAFISLKVEGLDTHSWLTGWALGALDMMALYYFVE